MNVIRTKSALMSARANWAGRVGFVPTMGALHEGHLALVREARATCATVVVSIFVNPTQFGDPADLDAYPSTMDADLAALERLGVDAVFVPDAAEIYPDGADTIVETPRLAGMLMGELRPGHFRGVATVVTKLFNLVRPDAAWFGAKDYQQVLVIRRMVTDLDMGVEIVTHPTVREPDGLAMSSRNLRLSAEDRAAAGILFQALQSAATAAKSGATPTDIETLARAVIGSEPRADLKSVDLRCAQTLEALAPDAILDRPAVLLVNAEFGPVLLIDNMVLETSTRNDATPDGRAAIVDAFASTDS